MSLAGLYFAKFGLLAALYLFLGAVLAVIVRDLRFRPETRSSPTGWWLVRLEGATEPAELPLASEVLLGRAPVCAMRIQDPFASGHHASLAPEGEGVRLTDLASSNGTLLGHGDRLTGSALLAAGDTFSVGEARFALKKKSPA